MSGEESSRPLPGSGEFLLKLLQKNPNQIQSNGQNFIHPPFAPHSYIQPQSPNPNLHESDHFPKLGFFGDNNGLFGENMLKFGSFGENSGNSRVLNGNQSDLQNSNRNRRVFSGNDADFRSSMDFGENSQNPRVLNGYDFQNMNNIVQNPRGLSGNELDLRNSMNFNEIIQNPRDFQNLMNLRNGVQNPSGISGLESDFRNSINLNNNNTQNPRDIQNLNNSRNRRGFSGNDADFRNPMNFSVNETDFRNYEKRLNSSRIGEGSNRIFNGIESDYRNSPNSGKIEAYNRHNKVLNGLEIDHRNSPINRSLNGLESNYRNRPDSIESDFSNLPNHVSRTSKAIQPPPGFSKKTMNKNVENSEKSSSNRRKSGSISPQLDFPPSGSALHSVSGFEIEESLSELHSEIGENGEKLKNGDSDDLDDNVVESLEKEEVSSNKNQKKKRDKIQIREHKELSLMSFNQPRGDSSQYRRTNRSGSFSQKNSNNFSGKGGGGAAAPPPSANLQPNRSFSKKSSNAQGGQYRASGYVGKSDLNSVSANPNAPNGSQFQPAPAPNVEVPNPVVKTTTEQPAQTSDQVVPNAPSQVTNVKPGPAPQATHTKDASKSFPIQFGSVSPGTLNGMQIPARTSSAPPNLVEQQRDQARRDAQRQAPPVPIPSVPKQQIPRKDGGAGDQPKAGEGHQTPKASRDIQVPSPVPASQTQKAHVHNISGVSMTMPFHHHVPVQFGGPNPQIQPQGMAGTSLTMPMHLPMGNATQLPHPIYLPGLHPHPHSHPHLHPHPHPHPHPMQAQGIMHQGQGLNFPSQIGQQMPPQIGNLGMGPGPQFPQLQQPSKFVGSRKPVKITHPDTHEELRLENAAGPRSHQNMPQSQPVTSVQSSHPMNYFPNPAFVPGQGPPRVSFPASQGSQTASFVNPSHKPPSLDSSHDVQKAVPSVAPASVQVTIKPATGVHGEKINDLGSSTPSVEKNMSQKHESGSVQPLMDSAIHPASSLNQAKSVVSGGTENRNKEIVTEKELSQPSSQVPGQSESFPSLPTSFSNKTSETSATKLSGSSIPERTGVESAKEPLPTGSATSDLLGFKSESNNISVVKPVDSPATEPRSEHKDVSRHSELLNSEGVKKDDSIVQTPSKSVSSKVLEEVNQTESKSGVAVRASSQEVGSLEDADKSTNDLCIKDNSDVASAPLVPDADGSTSTATSLVSSDGSSNISTTDTPVVESKNNRPAVVVKPVVSDDGVAPISLPEATLKSEEVGEDVSADLVSLVAASGKEEPTELNKSKSSVAKGKKKRKEILQKADAAGTTSDLYMAYKGPEEKKEIIAASENKNIKEVSVDSTKDDVCSSEKHDQGKTEPDDWEDATEISTPKLENTESGDKVSGSHKHVDSDEMAKKYTRDFLMKFSEQCTDLPEGFEITADVADALMVSNVNVSRESYPSPGRVMDRSPGGPRRGGVAGDEDRWNRFLGPLVPGRDIRMDGHGGNFRPGQGVNHGVLRNVRGQPSSQYAGGILSGPMQSMGSHVGVQRSNSDADRWQRATGFQKGLMPSPQTPAPVMHKAERKYQIGKIADDEEAKQRQLKAILNKLTPQNFERLFEQVKEVNIDNAGTLTGVISQIFDKALMEPTFCEMYANFCFHLAGVLPDFNEDNEKITFKRLLLNKCQEEFERGEREEEEAGRDDTESEVKQSPAEREEKRIQTRRRMLGNIRLIGELHKKRMLTERIMHECIKKLLGQYQNPDEENIESLCKLMSTIGEMIDQPKAKEHMDAYFDMMLRLSNNMKLSSRVRFMLKDAIDLRKNKWQERRKIEGPKKIEDVHRDAAQERQVQASRLARGPGPNSSVRNRQPMDFGSRGPNVLSFPSTQMGGYRGLQSQPRGFGVQDARMDDRHSFESRGPSVPLPQRPLGEVSITLGPQGGLARGMSSRGQLSFGNTPLSEAPSSVDSRRGPGFNGFGSVPDRPSFVSGDPRFNIPQRFSGPYDQGPILDRNASFGNRDVGTSDRTGNRSRPILPNVGGVGLIPSQNVPSGKVLPEERLKEMSLSTIKEFYSAKDENEVALCVKEFNSPSFHPTMIYLWVSDSFERKDNERDSLAKLLTNLSRSGDSLLNHDHLIQGFASVLSQLEDAVNDAPKAGEFLGKIFAKIVAEDVIPFSEIGQLIYEGGEEQGSLVEVGLAAEVVGTMLEFVKLEKGDSFLNEIRTSSGSKLERFRPPNSKKPLRLDKFI